ncbi:MAG TPA: hypothetical protein VFT02_15875 [Pyrinomonadaceae bacterium]|nr:hypothetical protein [Pyrinomonadaceae bacterium]
MRSKLTTGLLVFALLFVVVWNAHSQNSGPTQTFFMYQVIDDPSKSGRIDEGMKRLNQLGAEGWELAGVSGGEPAKLYLKKRLL